MSRSELDNEHFDSVLDQKTRPLSDLEDQISRSKQQLEALTDEKEQTHNEMKAYKFALNPVRRVPADVLQEIFLYFVDEDLEEDSLSTTNSFVNTATPWQVAQVSRHWRTVALFFPRMWSTIRIFVRQKDIDHKKRCRRRGYSLSLQLKRAAKHPLLVSIAASSDCHIPKFHPLLQALLPSSSQWKNLHIWLPFHTLSALGPIKANLQDLETLHLWCPDDPRPKSAVMRGSHCTKLFRFAPNLRTVVGDPALLVWFVIPWEQITGYTSGWNSDQQIFCLLQKISCLTTCDITVHPERKASLSPLTLNNLTHLSLYENSVSKPKDDGLSPSLQHLTLPRLICLEISSELLVVDSVLSLFRRSRCALQSLTLRSKSLHGQGDVLLLLKSESMASLVTLVIGRSQHIADAILHRLVTKLTLLPLLRSLTIEYDKNDDPLFKFLTIDYDENDDSSRYSNLLIARPHLCITAPNA